VFLPPTLGWLCLEAQRRGIVDVGLGVSLLVLAQLVVLGAVLWWSARAIAAAEAGGRRAQDAYRSTEESFRALVESVRDYAICTLDADGNVLTWNKGAERLEGYSADEVVGRSFSRVFVPEDVDVGVPQAELSRAATEGRAEHEGWRLRKDGTRYWGIVTLSPLRDEGGKLRGFAKVARDLTAPKRADDRLRAYATKLERSNRELETFASVASHDLQEPLRKIRAFGDRLVTKHAAALNPEGRDYLARMTSAAARMQELIDNLLTFSRVVTKPEPFVRVDLGEIARGVVTDLEARIDETRGRLDIGDLPVVEADATQMHQLLQNLLANALKFHRAGVSPVVIVRSRVVTDGAKGVAAGYEITVRDNGIGFEAEHAERIFGVFQRLHGRSEYAGTGIGLAICRRVVERHNGTIVARAVLGEGATFTIRLPALQPREPETA
jgi:PAS domain S-box-containing protein